MKISSILIKNFRKLQSCKIEFSEKETIFVGANNSGKTSAMDALMMFLKRRKLRTQDFTLYHWKDLNEIAESWLKPSDDKEEVRKDLSAFLPSLDLWIEVQNTELHYVSDIVPTLDWEGGLLGVRIRFEPKDMDELIKEFKVAASNSKTLLKKCGKKDFKLWPKTLWDFCERRLNDHFTFRTYLLDPSVSEEDQKVSEHSIAIEEDVFKGLIKIDTINAQRGFSDASSEKIDNSSARSLSLQLRDYYDNHLNPINNPSEEDIEALVSIDNAQRGFDNNLKSKFKLPLSELGNLNYPGFGNPQIQISTQLSASDGLQHDSAVKYLLDEGLSLPEKYNGLGYQNLISIVFKLIRFRDEWMKVGKNEIMDDEIIEPLHLVLIEEPEAHLHAQVQQVFIKKAYDVLRNHKALDKNKDDDKFDKKDKENEVFSTQMIVSTHSSYIAHQKFESLRYFKRVSLPTPKSEIVSLKSVFGEEDRTEKFVIRYLNTTHNDLFFADAVILVEGAAEKILLPHFIRHEHSELDKSYITILEIGGSHAHRLKPLIEKLGLICLVITDIDAKHPSNRSKCRPELNKELETSNDTLKSWHPKIKKLDKLLKLSFKDKVKKGLPIRVAFQTGIKINSGTVYPYTFEDALVIENKEVFKKIENNASGLLKQMIEASKLDDFEEMATRAYDEITKPHTKKAEFALDILYFEELGNIKTPKYIDEGLIWLKEQLECVTIKGKIDEEIRGQEHE